MMQPFHTYSLNLHGKLVTIDRPWVMGIINITPDSFYSGSRVMDEQSLVGQVTILSVDTYRAAVARRCVEEWGVDIINDISGGTIDEAMFATVADLRVPYVLMHMRGTPETMSRLTDYDNVAADVLEWMARRLDELRQMGVADVIADPGFGFAKTLEQNYQLLARLEAFHALNAPLLVGVSRKRMIYTPLDCIADEALNGTTVINTMALLQGAHILRVHDVKAAVEAVKLTTLTRQSALNKNQ